MQMEELSAAAQVRHVLDGPNVLILPHGAGKDGRENLIVEWRK